MKWMSFEWHFCYSFRCYSAIFGQIEMPRYSTVQRIIVPQQWTGIQQNTNLLSLGTFMRRNSTALFIRQYQGHSWTFANGNKRVVLGWKSSSGVQGQIPSGGLGLGPKSPESQIITDYILLKGLLYFEKMITMVVTTHAPLAMPLALCHL